MSLKLTRIIRHFNEHKIDDIEGRVAEELGKMSLPIDNCSIAIAVGSRGISNLLTIVRALIDCLKKAGAQPFIIPAMGSHGGATAEGQVDILESLSITEESVGAPTKSTMEVVELAEGVYMDKYAYSSNGVFLVNRIKPHTDYHAKYESGLVKMSVIGLGKHRQALEIHGMGIEGLKEEIPRAARRIIASGKILGGLAIVEDACENTAEIRAMKGEEIFEEEPPLLEMSRSYMPSLPLEDIDILVVERMGKNISGTGMDSNIIGRMNIRGVEEPRTPRIKCIIVADLSEESHGNAVGVGFADIITEKLFNKIDFRATYENAYTSTFLERAKTPVVTSDLKSAMEFAGRSLGYRHGLDERFRRECKVAVIRDTLHLSEVLVSKALLKDMERLWRGDEKRDKNGPITRDPEPVEFFGPRLFKWMMSR